MRRRLIALTAGAVLVFAGLLVPSDNSRARASESAAPPGNCSLKNLAVTVPSGSAAGGSEGMLIAFRNMGAATCYLQGYPKVIATRNGTSVTAIASPSTYLGGLNPDISPPLVTLNPGTRASVVVAAGDEPPTVTSRCVHRRYKSVTVSLPEEPGSKTLSARLPREATSLPSCTKPEVTPFQSGLTWFAP